MRPLAVASRTKYSSAIWQAHNPKEGHDRMSYKGIAKGNVIELESALTLPSGTEVEVVVLGRNGEELAPSGFPKGSSQALMVALNLPPHCTTEDVDALMEAIEQGRRPVRYKGAFDRKGG